ncbi:apolipoprotein N-acyltransferase [Pseudoroseicyclus aestuarii]|uniref:Apolipoprotein N-acyltransferase n=1 Tax=Pseudoroseicyclus aestuarii TaxID=1795041 RepID=A0A318SW40_9RHOB|nr:apolipoprotein N-acyltransferase [Pseudoroseicyclus aestuarii]PYE84067.1 apolipoprotein N-acyltransferase [Pseudoroseicyclus aestuarii]
MTPIPRSHDDLALARLLARRGARPAAAAALGALAALGLAPLGWWWITLPALALALRLPAAQSRRAAFLHGWALGFGWFGLSLSWIVEPFFVDIARDGWMAPFALVLLPGGMALYWGAALALGWRRRIWALVAAWCLAEMLRSWLFSGFPWSLPGHIWIDTPLAQLSALGGPFLLTALTLGLAAVIARVGPRPWLALPALAMAGGWIVLDPGPAPAPRPEAPLVRLVQPNQAQALKSDPAMAQIFFDGLLALSAGAPGDPRPDLIVWPEVAIPWPLDVAGGLLEETAQAVGGVPVALGLQRREGARWYNSLAVLDARGRPADIYDKSHLVPFGEFVPFGDIMARFGIYGLAASEGGGYSAGQGLRPVAVPGIGTALPLICYEGIFAGEVSAGAARGAVRPRMLMLVTNDAWFGTLSGPYQHFAQARLRAIEMGLPMVRVGNTGISAMIDGRGRVLARLDLGHEGALDAALPPALGVTPFARFGSWPMALLLCAAFIAALPVRRAAIDPAALRA